MACLQVNEVGNIPGQVTLTASLKQAGQNPIHITEVTCNVTPGMLTMQ